MKYVAHVDLTIEPLDHGNLELKEVSELVEHAIDMVEEYGPYLVSIMDISVEKEEEDNATP